MEKKAVNKGIDFAKVYDDAEKKRIELEAKLKIKVKKLVLAAKPLSDEPCICFFRPATTYTKMQCRDLMYSSPSKAAALLFDCTLIKEESDKRVLIQDNDEDYFYMGALEWCSEQNLIATSFIKKK